MKVINLAEKFDLIGEHWSPRIVGQVNDTVVKLAKLKGEFVWHHHEMEDELFMVIKGRLKIRLADGELTLCEGELAVIPHGVEHCPVAEDEVHVLLLESASTVNTGTLVNDRTVDAGWI